MGHALIIGTTASGKTDLAKRLAHRYRSGRAGNKRPVLVCDPFMDDWDADLVTPDMEKFMKAAQTNHGCVLFIDESGESVGQHNDETFWLATNARHYGHQSFFISQRAQQIAPTVRGQCHHLFLFCVSPKDADLLANEFVSEELKDAPNLPQYNMIWRPRFGTVRRVNLDRRQRRADRLDAREIA